MNMAPSNVLLFAAGRERQKRKQMRRRRKPCRKNGTRTSRYGLAQKLTKTQVMQNYRILTQWVRCKTIVTSYIK